jgi:hypothetical protein
MDGLTRMDRIRKKYIRGSFKEAPVTKKMRSNRLAFHRHVMWSAESQITKREVSMNVYGNDPKISGCNDMRIKAELA